MLFIDYFMDLSTIVGVCGLSLLSALAIVGAADAVLSSEEPDKDEQDYIVTEDGKIIPYDEDTQE